MVLPLYDTDPLDQNPWAVVTWSLIVLNVLVFVVERNASETAELAMIRDYALIPAAITGKVTLGGSLPPIVSVFTYTFLHGGCSHNIANTLFLSVLGDHIEDAMGSLRIALS